MPPLRPGLVLDGKVRLTRILGEGAMGTVWVAQHLALDTEVAVKVIRHFVDNEEVRARFDMEAKAAARIRSPHVVQIFDHGVAEDDLPYMVMELLEGESLARRLERTGWLSFKQCARVVSQVAKALERAHALGIVHRDIKPENIFLCPSDDGPFIKLLDFGVAKTTALGQNPKLTNAGVMIGTPEYMSRQQVISAKMVEPEADLWALSVVAYEMLTGDVPFTGETVGQICVAICQGEVIAPTELRKGLPPGIDRWFERAFQNGEPFPHETATELAKAFRAELLPERYGVEDELSDEVFVPQTGTHVGIGPHADLEVVVEETTDGDARVSREPSPQSEPSPEVEPEETEPDASAAAPLFEPAASGVPSRARWWLAAGLLPLLVGLYVFAGSDGRQPAADGQPGAALATVPSPERSTSRAASQASEPPPEPSDEGAARSDEPDPAPSIPGEATGETTGETTGEATVAPTRPVARPTTKPSAEPPPTPKKAPEETEPTTPEPSRKDYGF